MNWKIVGDGTRTAHTDEHAFKIVVDHVGLNISVAPVTHIDPWTNAPVIGKYEHLAYGFNYDQMREVAERYGK